MKNVHYGALIALPLAFIMLLGYIVPGGAAGANIVLDESMISYAPEEPELNGSFNVTVDPLFIDAEPIEGGVLLMWSLCTEDGCGIAQPIQMSDNGDGTWSVVLGGRRIIKKPGTGKPYLDILFYVKITAVPTGGGDEFSEQSDSITVFFKEGSTPVDDDDDTAPDDDDDDDGDDSPFGLEILLIGIIAAGALVYYRKRH
jgi:hypothetical protein